MCFSSLIKASVQHTVIRSRLAWASSSLLVVYRNDSTIPAPVSVTLHVTCTPAKTDNASPQVRHRSHANIETHCVISTFYLSTLNLTMLPVGQPSLNYVRRHDMHHGVLSWLHCDTNDLNMSGTW